jgi:hypothetical protein
MKPVDEISIAPAAMDGLRARFRGVLLRPGEEGYDEARRIWNGAIDRRPKTAVPGLDLRCRRLHATPQAG